MTCLLRMERTVWTGSMVTVRATTTTNVIEVKGSEVAEKEVPYFSVQNVLF
jgi:hypothetical protein